MNPMSLFKSCWPLLFVRATGPVERGLFGRKKEADDTPACTSSGIARSPKKAVGEQRSW